MLSWMFSGGWESILGVIAVFLVLVTIHEFGHFIVAKKSGVLVPKFAIGFGPVLFRFGKGETEYSIRLFPLGGYVQLAGEIPQDTFFKLGEPLTVSCNDHGDVWLLGDQSDLPDGTAGTLRSIDTTKAFTMSLETADGVHSYRISRRSFLVTGKDRIPLAPPDRQMGQKPLYIRAAIVFAGPLMNVLLTIVLFSFLAGVIGVPASPPALSGVEVSSPAGMSGLHAGDEIIAVNGKPVTTWNDFVVVVQSHPKQTLVMSVVRAGRTFSVDVTPAVRSDGTGFIGVTPATTHNPILAVENGVSQTGAYTQMIFGALGSLFTHTQSFVNDTGGPVKIATVIGQQAQLGILNLINVTAVLSLNLAIFNLLPIPALDGSRLLFMLVEFLRGKPIDPRKEYIVHAIGLAVMLLLTVFRTYLDVAQLKIF